MAEVAAEARGVSHRYGAGAPALRDVDLAAERGVVTALIGANGSGKTTLLRVLAGVLAPTAGTVRVLGVDRPAALGRRAGRRQRRKTGYLSQDPALDPEMTCGEILTLLAAFYGVRRRERRQRVGEIAAAFGLESLLKRRVDALSGGQRRRLHLAAGMIHDPELLCLDEPAAGLDPEATDLLWAELEDRARRGRATVIVSHDLAAVERHAATVVILDRGVVVAAGSPADLAATNPPDLAHAYRRLTGREPAALEPRRGAVGGKGGKGR